MHGDMGGTRARCFAGAFVMSEVMSKNVAKLIAILATFSWTGHNQATLDFSRIAERPGRIGMSTTSRTVQSQTGSQEVRGFETFASTRKSWST